MSTSPQVSSRRLRPFHYQKPSRTYHRVVRSLDISLRPCVDYHRVPMAYYMNPELGTFRERRFRVFFPYGTRRSSRLKPIGSGYQELPSPVKRYIYSRKIHQSSSGNCHPPCTTTKRRHYLPFHPFFLNFATGAG